ncbi:small metal-binding protein SmbP [Nitrospira sp. MA-1]|nr:small metal-binding protein SmbP [Nitrospira sp. MA-1]
MLSWIPRLTIALLCMGLMAGCASYSTGTVNPHVAEALTHAQEAVDHGGMGHADVVVTHVEASLQHAQAAKKDMNNPHLDAAIAELGEAIAHGEAGHADVATSHAKSAVIHLNQINGMTPSTESNEMVPSSGYY